MQRQKTKLTKPDQDEFLRVIDSGLGLLKRNPDRKRIKLLERTYATVFAKIAPELFLPSNKTPLAKKLEELKLILTLGELIDKTRKGELNSETTVEEVLKSKGIKNSSQQLLALTKKSVGQDDLSELRKKSFENVKKYHAIQMDIACGLDLTSISPHLPVNEALKMQLHAALQLKHLIVDKVQRLKEYLESSVTHRKEMIQNPVFYPPLQTLQLLFSYIPADVLPLTVFLDKQKDNFENFLKREINIAATVETIFYELSSKQRKTIVELIENTRKLVISYANNFYQLGDVISQHCRMINLSESELSALRRNASLLFIENIKEKACSDTSSTLFKFIAEVDTTFLSTSMKDPNFFIEKDTYKFCRQVFEKIKLSTFVGCSEVEEDKKAEEAKAAIHENPAKKKKKKKKKKKVIAVLEEAKPTRSEETPPVAIKTIALFQPAPEELELKRLIEFANFQVPEMKDENILQICASIQANALLFGIIKLMEKRKKSPNAETALEAKYIRNALVHCKGLGLINEMLLVPNRDPMNLSKLLQEIKGFCLLVIKKIQTPGDTALEFCHLYQQIIAHGKHLEVQLLSGAKENISGEERLTYTQLLALQWTQFNIPVAFPVPAEMFEHAIKMVVNKFITYGNFHFEDRIVKRILAEKHGEITAPADLSEISFDLAKRLSGTVS